MPSYTASSFKLEKMKVPRFLLYFIAKVGNLIHLDTFQLNKCVILYTPLEETVNRSAVA